MAVTDRGYTTLLTHLHRPNTSLSLSAIQASISHFLANVEPSPTPLSASIISSPFFRLYSRQKLVALTTAFRHAVHFKLQLLKRSRSASIFSRSPDALLTVWLRSVLKGCQGGQAMLRFACCGGLLIGLEDVKRRINVGGNGRERVENEVVVALAEIMDLYAYEQESNGWEKEFQPNTKEDGLHSISLALLMASQFMPVIPSEKLKVLPLGSLTCLLTSTISAVYHSGTFLSSLPSAFTQDSSGKLTFLSSNHPMATTLQELTSSPLFLSIAPLSKLCARCISLLSDSKPDKAWDVMAQTLTMLDSLAQKVEADWILSALSTSANDEGVPPTARDLLTTTWTTLKTLLFTNIMLSQSILSSLLFMKPSPSIPHTPPSLALLTLKTLSHLSFVISQFGSITSTSTTSGFKELKKTVYTALDILASDKGESERFVQELCGRFGSEDTPSSVLARKSFALVCIEQLVPVLSGESLEQAVFPLCLPHLSVPSHRETYESSHSVVLAIFSINTERRDRGELALENRGVTTKGKGKEVAPPFIDQIVPFYVNCLIENSHEGALTTAQLRLAFATLAASVSSSPDDSLLCFCIYSLLAVINFLSSPSGDSASTSALGAVDRERLHRLTLALVSTLSALPLAMLPRVLDDIRDTIIFIYPPTTFLEEDGNRGRREELVEALFAEILERVGDREKEFTMRWWYQNRERMVGVERWDGEGPRSLKLVKADGEIEAVSKL